MGETSGDILSHTGIPDNSVLVGTGKPTVIDAFLQQPMDRRGFLKTVATGLVAATSAAAIPNRIVEAAKKENVQFKELTKDGSLSLYVGNKATYGTEQAIHYFGAKSKLQIRLSQDGSMVCKPFSHDAETVRKYGEIVDPRLSKLTRNPDLADTITIGMYKKVTNNRDLTERESLNEGNCWGIPVITQAKDYMLSGTLPMEHSKSHREEYGIGWAVGSMVNNTFNLQGFVLDSRALVPAAT